MFCKDIIIVFIFIGRIWHSTGKLRGEVLFIHLQNHGPFPSRLLLSGLGKHLVANLPEDILLGAWGAVGGSGAGDGVDVGCEAGRRQRRGQGTAAVRRPTHLRHRAMSRGRETLSWPRHAR